MNQQLLSNARVYLPDDSVLSDGAVALAGDRIAWVGPRDALPADLAGWPQRDLGGDLLTPGLIDCHTHLVHGGHRAQEFEQRLQGASYTDIARAGGGILGTVRATRAASVDALVDSALPRLDALLTEGLSVIEIKSGYGLDRETELKMLRAATQLGRLRPVQVVRTFLGAHAIPPEFAGRADDYLDRVCLPTLEAAHAEGLVDMVDGFCEGIAFSVAQIERLFDRAEQLGLPLKLHAEQLSALGGARMAAQRGARSVEHLEYLDAQDAAVLAANGTVAVLLPGAFYTLQETRKPPVAALREAGVDLAISTDCNPGSSPLSSLLLTMNMACTLFGLTPTEALAGVTRHAARALGLEQTDGAIAVGRRAELLRWAVQTPAELSYRVGFNPLRERIRGSTA
ncbi:MAG: imidazolonepropionase [Abyssibacter sp.]|uniref:imidazolonepropionase n=1 Tax=Abyssibacter sp. TaxID=2320200 RepID=UPI003219750B